MPTAFTWIRSPASSGVSVARNAVGTPFASSCQYVKTWLLDGQFVVAFAMYLPTIRVAYVPLYTPPESVPYTQFGGASVVGFASEMTCSRRIGGVCEVSTNRWMMSGHAV